MAFVPSLPVNCLSNWSVQSGESKNPLLLLLNPSSTNLTMESEILDLSAFLSYFTDLLLEAWVPVLVAALLELGAHLHRVVGVGQGQGLRREQGEVEVTGLRQPSDHCDRPLQAPVQQLGRERVLLRLDVHARRRRQHLLRRHHRQLVSLLGHGSRGALGQN